MLGFLLFVQGLLLCTLGLLSGAALYLFLTGNFEEITRWTGLSAEAQRPALPDWIATLILFPLSLLSVVAAVGFMRLGRNAWLYAMFVQGAILLTSLLFYFRGKPDYFSMGFSVFIVIYLNYAEVRASFRPPQGDIEAPL